MTEALSQSAIFKVRTFGTVRLYPASSYPPSRPLKNRTLTLESRELETVTNLVLVRTYSTVYQYYEW